MITYSEDLGTVATWAVDLMERLGAPGVGVAIAMENLFPPLPSEVVLPLAGFTASLGSFGLLEVLLWATVGSVVGALALYGVGAALGRDRMRRLVAYVPLVQISDVDRSEAWFARHGATAVLLGRMVPIFRSLISIPAGIERMPIGKFLVLTTIGSAVWNTAFVLAGYVLGESWHKVERYGDVLQAVVVVAVVGSVVGLVLVRTRRRLGARRAATADRRGRMER
ncbi:DedA family protein [Cellulomonas sp. URHE0023]|uniref:DedA family protein n=1 Tax=Cellulomonas sp. URHE0023 TaxID=1380354 RepID=UPI0005549DAC|nr:DedA family protein [Cellulomonas sp. URHE0023]